MSNIKGLKKWINPCFHKNTGDYSHRIEVYYGGAGSGKSHFVTQKVIIKGINEKRKILVVRKVGTTLKDSCWALFLHILTPFSINIKSINKTDYTITLNNGTQFIFKGLDDKEKIKSIYGITDIFVEEATELTLDDFTQLNLRLRSNAENNQIFLCFNPVSKANWVYKYFFEQNQKDTLIIKTTHSDNPRLPDEYIKSLQELKNTNPAYYRIYVLGEFATLDKLVFPIITKRLIAEEETKELAFWCGIDFGYVADPTAIIWGYYDAENKNLLITGEYFKKGMTNDRIAETLVNLGLSKERIIADCAEQKSIEEIKRMGVRRIKPCAKGKDSIMNGIDKMLRCHIIVDERCTGLIEEFENYTWKKDKQSNEYMNEPCDAFNHGIDAVRYGLQAVIAKKGIKPIPREFM